MNLLGPISVNNIGDLGRAGKLWHISAQVVGAGANLSTIPGCGLEWTEGWANLCSGQV